MKTTILLMSLILLSPVTKLQALEAPEITLTSIQERTVSVVARDINNESLTVYLSIDQGPGTTPEAVSENSESLFYTLSGLIPHTDYRFIAKACNTINCSDNAIKLFTTLPQTPTKPVTNLRTSVTENSLSVLFNAPIETNHKDGISSYQLQLFPYDSLSSCFDNNHEVISTTSAQYQFTGLSPQQDYYLCIRSVNALGPGTNSTGYLRQRLTTAAGLPQQAPVVQEIFTEQQLTVIRWQPLNHEQANGEVIQNDVRYRQDGSSEWQERQFPGDGSMAFLILNQVTSGKLYEFAVRSHTSAGAGPWSDNP